MGEMNHLLLRPGRQLIVYVKALLLGGFCHPTLPLLLSLPSSSPWVAPAATLRAQTGYQPKMPQGKACLLCPLAALLPTQRKGRVSEEEARLGRVSLLPWDQQRPRKVLLSLWLMFIL